MPRTRRSADGRRRRDGPPVVAMVATHPTESAASRLRMAQYFPALRAGGMEPVFWSFLADGEEVPWLTGSLTRRLWLVLRGLARIPRLAAVLRAAAVVVVQREILPFGPPLVERFAARGRRFVWDVDDAVWEHHTSVGWMPKAVRATAGKYERLCRRADEVWAGSEMLAAWCRSRNTNVQVVPTVIDVPDESPSDDRARVVAWIGTPTTGPFVDEVLPILAGIEPPLEIEVVGHGATKSSEHVSSRPWSPVTEREVLRRARVGLYPIDRCHPLADGKCGLKAILYMASGVVPVVTPTPTNVAVVHDERHGLHADDADGWRVAVQRLLEDDELWARLRIEGHRWVRSEYSLDRWAPVVAARLATLAGLST